MIRVKKKLDVANQAYLPLVAASYILITVVIVSILIGCIYVWFDGYTRQALSTSSEADLEHWDALFTQQINAYYRQLENACQQAPIRNYVFSNQSTELQNYEAYLSFHTITSADPNIDCMILFRSENEIRFLGPTLYSEEEREYLKEHLFASKSDRDYFCIDSGSHHEICLFWTDRTYFGNPPTRGIMITVDLDDLGKTMNPSTLYPLLVFDDNGQALFDQKMDESSLQLVWNNISEHKGDDTEDEKNEIILNDNRYIITTRYDETLHLTFCRLVDFNANHNEIVQFTRNLYLIIVVLILMTLLLSLVLTRIMYRPIRTFVQQLGRYTLSAEDGQSSASRVTTDTSERILNRVGILSVQYHSNNILAYLEANPQQTACPDSINFEKNGTTGWLALFWVSRHLPDENVLHEVKTFLTNELPQMKLEMCWDQRSVWFAVILQGTGACETLVPALTECIKTNQLNTSRILSDRGRLFAVISHPMQKGEELNAEFTTLLSWTKYSLFHETPKLLTVSSREPGENIPEQIFDPILEFVRSGDQEQAILAIPQMLDAVGEGSIETALKQMATFCMKVENITVHREFTDAERREKYLNYYVKISALSGRYELETYLRNLISDACLENMVYQEKSSRLDILEAIGFIGEHYCDPDISVERVAEQFAISASYFSRSFNNYVGKSFPEYVTDLRMSRAHDLILQYPRVSIKKISEACGYSGVSYFSSQFRKKYGISPTQLRSQEVQHTEK
jgi:AraC-like DNA-binding protein